MINNDDHDAEDLAACRLQLKEQEQQTRRWQQYTYALIAIAPVEIRRHVASRLDVTGRGVIEDGLWNLILDRTMEKP